MTGPRLFAAYCALVLLVFSVAKYQGWALFGSPAQPAAAASSGGTRGGGGSSGSHK